jgi:Uma2 family endonuclease
MGACEAWCTLRIIAPHFEEPRDMEKQLVRLSAAEYLEQESRSAMKHEYLDGEVFPMGATSRNHNFVVGNLMQKARTAAVSRSQCQVFGSDTRVFVEPRNCFYYPDLSVSFDPSDRESRYLAHPSVIVEVLSPSTTGTDRREKRMHYATIPSLQEYVIVDQDRMRVNVFPRADSRLMLRILNEPDDIVEISSLGLRLSLREIYAGVEFEGPGAPPVKSAEVKAPAVIGSSRNPSLT